MEYISVKEMAARWGVTVRRIQALCARNRIDGAVKHGRSWMIPSSAEKPADARVISGKYRNWRKHDRNDSGKNE